MATKKQDDDPKHDPRNDTQPPKGKPEPKIGAQDPYPTGGARDDEAGFEAAHGYRRDDPAKKE